MAEKIRILIVDDEDGLRTLLKSELDGHGFNADEADGGIMALEMLGKNNYSLLILDILMPDMDGLAVLRAIQPRLPSLKVIMLTGVGEMKIARECVQLGASDFLSKPIELKNLLACISRVIKE